MCPRYSSSPICKRPITELLNMWALNGMKMMVLILHMHSSLNPFAHFPVHRTHITGYMVRCTCSWGPYHLFVATGLLFLLDVSQASFPHVYSDLSCPDP